MSFFKRNKGPVIPPVQSEKRDPYANAGGGGGGGDPYASRGNGDPYASRGGGDPYASRGGGGGGDPYANNMAGVGLRNGANGGGGPGRAGGPAAGVGSRGGGGGGRDYTARDGWGSSGNPYARQGEQVDEAARNELFAGFQPPKQERARREYGYEGREEEEGFDEDEEIEGIKQEMRGVKQDSLASTRNALRLAREAEDNARGTVAKLADQSERIANSERYLDMAKANNQRAEDKTEELRQLNKSIFKPVIVWNKDAKRQMQEDKINRRHAMERADRAKALDDISDTRRRLGEAANPRPGDNFRQPLPGEQRAKKEARERFQFEATASDDELEDEMDDNLGQIYDVTKRLKGLATAMGDEVAGQNGRLTRVTDKTDDLELGVMKNTDRLKRIR